jgi:adenosylhomocysteine nucleosidase
VCLFCTSEGAASFLLCVQVGTYYVIIVVGLAFEARIAAGPGVHVICSGDGRNLAAKLTAAIAESRTLVRGCPGIISFGVAGGLAPDLSPGTCVVGSAVISGSERMPISAEWSRKLLKTIPDAVSGILLGVPKPIANPDEKRALYLETGAIAVDMESHIVASVGLAHEIPVAAIRVITDPAKRALPASAVAAMRANGTTNIGAMLRSVLKRPRELPALLQTALDARAARAALVRGRSLLGPAFTLPQAS